MDLWSKFNKGAGGWVAVIHPNILKYSCNSSTVLSQYSCWPRAKLQRARAESALSPFCIPSPFQSPLSAGETLKCRFICPTKTGSLLKTPNWPQVWMLSMNGFGVDWRSFQGVPGPSPQEACRRLQLPSVKMDGCLMYFARVCLKSSSASQTRIKRESWQLQSLPSMRVVLYWLSWGRLFGCEERNYFSPYRKCKWMKKQFISTAHCESSFTRTQKKKKKMI